MFQFAPFSLQHPSLTLQNHQLSCSTCSHNGSTHFTEVLKWISAHHGWYMRKMLLLLAIVVQMQVHKMNNNLKPKCKNCYVHHSCIQAGKERGFSMRISTNQYVPFLQALECHNDGPLCHFNFLFYLRIGLPPHLSHWKPTQNLFSLLRQGSQRRLQHPFEHIPSFVHSLLFQHMHMHPTHLILQLVQIIATRHFLADVYGPPSSCEPSCWPSCCFL
jgi:hypothetical protein